MSIRVRFAPSPTGFLHVGGARTALFNYLHAKGKGGTLVLRIEDTDAARSTPESLDAILNGMQWLGLAWDEGPGVGGDYGPYFQSERRALYRERADALIAGAQAYPCYCTPEEDERRRAEQVARGEAPRYDSRCRDLDADARHALEQQGRVPAVRFRLDAEGETAWEDVVRGRVAFQNAVLDDFVLVRSDGLPTYNFACVVDDLAMRITDVIRGDDHISNTPRQLLLYRAFDQAPPQFAHVPMILGPDGARLSKRHGATSVEAYRDLGIIPAALVNFLALLGWSLDGTREMFSLAELEQSFRLDRVGSNPAVFNMEKLEWMNGQHLKRLDPAERARLVREFVATQGFDASHPDAWWERFAAAIGDRLKTLHDADNYGRFALVEALEIDEAAWTELRERPDVALRLEGLADGLERSSFTDAELETVTRGYAKELGIKAGELIGIARVALTGRTVSPGIFDVMALLGKERTLERLRSAAARWRSEAKTAV